MTADAQRLAALARANEVRVARGGWKRELRELPLDVALVSARRRLLAPPWWLQSMTVHDFLLALPRVGRSRARSILTGASVSRSRRVGDLVARERQALAGWFEERIDAERERSAA